MERWGEGEDGRKAEIFQQIHNILEEKFYSNSIAEDSEQLDIKKNTQEKTFWMGVKEKF